MRVGGESRAERRPTLLFLSSIAAAMGMGWTSDTPIKEEVFEDLNAPAVKGYTESKYIAERLLERAAHVLGLNARIARAGQVCGPARSKGAWKRDEWLPSLVLGSRCLNAMPDSLGAYGPAIKDVDWVPVDVLAEVLIDIATKDDEANGSVSKGDSGTVEVFHTFKQPALGWTDLVPAVLEAMKLSSPSRSSSRGDMKIVSPAEWLENLRANASFLSEKADADDSGSEKDTEALLRENPAIKLLDFYQNKPSENSVLKWDTSKAEGASRTLKQAQAITPDMMMGWVQNWISEGT
jgi:thioester reductase-like protein